VDDSWAGALLEVRGVGVTRGRARLLDEVDVVAEPRSWTAVVGPNGAGKSTLLRCIAGLQSHEGSVLVDGNGVESLRARERAQEIGYAPQVPLLPEAVTVAEYVLLGRTPAAVNRRARPSQAPIIASTSVVNTVVRTTSASVIPACPSTVSRLSRASET